MVHETHDLNARMIKIVGTKYPRLRSMIRNHPYTKIVGMSVIKCLTEEIGMSPDAIDDELLTHLIEQGIRLYHEHEESIRMSDVLEHKRRMLCEGLKTAAQEHLALAG